jgi:organic hydroperoxide reductase OsmC/OhrA
MLACRTKAGDSIPGPGPLSDCAMQEIEHTYTVRVEWTGNSGRGTASYRGYGRAHVISARGKPALPGSSDPAFRGDPSRYSPEDLLVASLSSCHMLWYLHLCADAGIVVVEYLDQPVGTMLENRDTGGRFVEVALRPRVTITTEGDIAPAVALHERAHRLCFIANSVNFPVRCEPTVELESRGKGPAQS